MKTNKKIKGWAILLLYKNDPPFLFGIHTDKADTIHQYKSTQLYKPEYTIIPVTISFTLPTPKKKKAL